MPIDSYSLCPCGNGKKVKFCCPDLLPELQKIDKMIEGEQFIACLEHIDHLLENDPDRASLMAIKGLLLRTTGQVEPATENAKHFVDTHPENTTALAEYAIILAATEGGPPALEVLQKAMGLSEGGIQAVIYDAMSVTAETLISEGNFMAGRAIFQLQMAINHEDERPVEALISMNRSPRIPLLFKDDPPLRRVDDAPWKDKLDEALKPVETGIWQEAVDRLTKLSDEVTDSPIIWRDLATLRGWVADDDGAIDALNRYAALDIPLEDAVEATTLARMLGDDPLDDPLEVFALQWKIEDIDTLLAALTMDKRTMQVPVNPMQVDEDNPPPKGSYVLLDRPEIERSEGISTKNVPLFVGRILVFGKQTDRDAQLSLVGVTANDLDKAKQIIGELAEKTISGEPEQEVMSKVSASADLLQSKIHPPADASPDELETLGIATRREAVVEKWPNLKLGLLDGKSPRDVAGDDAYRLRLLAAVMVMESWCEPLPGTFDMNEVRKELGLPVLDPIDPTETPVDSVPLVRLQRIEIEKLNDDDLLYAYRRAVAYGVNGAMKGLATAVIERPSLAGKEEQLRALETLARTEEDSERALEFVTRGQEMSVERNQSPAPWLMLELQFRFARGEANEVSRLVNTLQTRHMQEPGVAQALTQFMMQIGAIRPDGSPAQGPGGPGPMGPGPAGQPGPAPAEDANKLWTPDSDSGGGAPGGGKIWTPD